MFNELNDSDLKTLFAGLATFAMSGGGPRKIGWNEQMRSRIASLMELTGVNKDDDLFEDGYDGWKRVYDMQESILLELVKRKGTQ